MTSEVELDLASIPDEDILRRMWQQTEDFGRKKQIRSHIYKLRENRLKDFYATGDMDVKSGIGLTKNPLTLSHGESLIDQSFQSFKTKEVRDSESPTHEFKCKTTNLSDVVAPDTSGWNVITSSEVGSDGKEYKTETLATTEGVKKLHGGHSQFTGINEHKTQEFHEGNEKNYVEKAGESSKTCLQESTVIDDENSSQRENKSSTVVSSSSHTITSKFTSSGDDVEMIPTNRQHISHGFNEIEDSNIEKLSKLSRDQSRFQNSNIESRATNHEEKIKQQQRRNHQIQNEKNITENFNTARDSIQSDEMNDNINRIEQAYEKQPKVTKVYLEEEVNKLAALPGTLISRKIDYPDSNTKMITETKELVDGTIVTTKTYEKKSAKAKTWQSDTSDEQLPKKSLHTYHEDDTQSKPSTSEIQDKTYKSKHDTITSNKRFDLRSSEFTDEANGRASEIQRDDIQKQKIQQKQIHHEEVSKNESFNQHEICSVHRKEVERHNSDICRDKVESLKDQIENIASDKNHRTVKKDLSQIMRNEKITSQDFIETGKKGSNQISNFNSTNLSQIHEHSSVEPQTPQEKQPTQQKKNSQDFTTYGFPSVEPQKLSSKQHPYELKNEYTISQTDSTRQTSKNYDTQESHELYSSHMTSKSKMDNLESYKESNHQRKPLTEVAKNEFPSVKSHRYVQGNDSYQSPQNSVVDKNDTEEYYATKHYDKEQHDQHSDECQQSKFETHVLQSIEPNSKKEDFIGTHGYPSVQKYLIDDQRSTITAADINSKTMKQQTNVSERSETSKTRNNDRMTSSRITVEVGAAHEAFVRSLRCVSPVDQQRPSSSKSLRTNSISVRSSISPDKRSEFSPSRDSESSKISSSTVVKSNRGIDSSRQSIKNKSTIKPLDSKITAKKVNQSPKWSETDHLTKSKFDRHNSAFKKVPENSTSDYSVSRPSYSSLEHPTMTSSKATTKMETKSAETVQNIFKSKNPLSQPFYDIQKTNRSQTSPEKISSQINTDKSKQIKKKMKNEDEGFEGESPRSNSPTCIVSQPTEKHQISDYDATDITIEVNLKNMGNNVNVIGTVDNEHPRYSYNDDFISKEKEITEINQNKKNQENFVEDKSFQNRTTNKEYYVIQKKPHENIYLEQSFDNYRKHDNGSKPNSLKEPFFLKEQIQNQDESRNTEHKAKIRPILTRSETYEERCRKILGMDHTLLNDSSTGDIQSCKVEISYPDITNNFLTTEKEKQENKKTETFSIFQTNNLKKVTKPDKPANIVRPSKSSAKKNIVSDSGRKNNEKTFSSVKSSNTSPSSCIVQRSKASTRETLISKKYDQPISLKLSLISTPSRSSYSSPSTWKDTPNETPRTRSPGLSPVRKSMSKAYERSPTRNESKPILEDVEKTSSVIVTSVTSNVAKNKNPERQNHITTAKIHLSPTLTRKHSTTPEMKKQSKSPDTQSKSETPLITSTKHVSEKPTARSISHTQKRDQNFTESNRKFAAEKKLVTKFEQSKIDTDKITTQKIMKFPSDLTSPKNLSSKKLQVTERKESAPVYRTTDITNQKYLRSTSENIIKPQRTKPEIEVNSTKGQRKNPTDKPRKNSFERRPNKCLTTKTINLTTTNNLINCENMENVIIDIQQAKSSREPSPNKIIPTPVGLDEDTGMPRYPDRIQEPDEKPNKPTIKNIPIFEEENNEYFGCQVTEVNDIEEDFFNNQQMNARQKKPSPIREDIRYSAPKETDVCLLSVHEKVFKFISTAEEVQKPKSSAPFYREESSKTNITEVDDCLLSVTDKVAKFMTTAENVTKSVTSAMKEVERPNLDSLDNELKEDRCVLSVSEKVNKFTTTAPSYQQKSAALVAKIDRQMSSSQFDSENDVPFESHEFRVVESERKKPISKPLALKSTEVVQKTKSVFERGNKYSFTGRQRDILSHPSVWEGKKSTAADVELQCTDICENRDDENKISTNKISTSQPIFTKSKRDAVDHHEINSLVLKNKLKEPVNKFLEKSSKMPSDKSIPSRTSERTVQQNTVETIRENPQTSTNKTQHITKFETHLTTDKFVEDGKTNNYILKNKVAACIDIPSKSVDGIAKNNYAENSLNKILESSQNIIRPEISKTQTTTEYTLSRQTSDAKKPNLAPSRQDLISAKLSFFEKSDKVNEARPSYMDHTVSSMEHRRDSTEITKQPQRSSVLKENDMHDIKSARPMETFGIELRRSNSKDSGLRRKSSCSDIPHIEYIFDLELLQQMLNTVVGYEQRRRIRTQIRLVKKTLETQNKKENQIAHKAFVKKIENTPGFLKASSKSSDTYRSTSREGSFLTNLKELVEIDTKKDELACSKRSVSPIEKIREVRDKSVSDGKPIWATKNILKKASENTKLSKPGSISKSTIKAQRQKITSSDEDCITSSYGIGPTDEDGRPLFGIRALKKFQPVETTRVNGKMVTEEYYSKNGSDSIGKRSVTVYSTNLKDMNDFKDETESQATETTQKSTKRGFKILTNTRKFDKQQVIENSDVRKPEIKDAAILKGMEMKTPKIVRKGSVKAISDKLIRKESSSSVTEKTCSNLYPKAGLILRAKAHSNKDDDDQIDYSTEEFNIEIKPTFELSRTVLTESDSEKKTVELKNIELNQSEKSFLNSSGKKVTSVSDVLQRMRNADNVFEDGDREEDQEARALLNKFLGASVIMSGIESMVPKEITVTNVRGSPHFKKQEVKTTHITKFITKEDSSSPVKSKTCDIEEILDAELLNSLLKKSTSAEERRKIRARLRQLMAEREESSITKIEEKGDTSVKKTTTVTTQAVSSTVPKPVSAFSKFRQLDKQNSVKTPSSPLTPSTPGGSNREAPIFEFTDPALNARAATVKDQLLQWCQIKTKEYENVQINNFSTSWIDGLAFCALIHHFLPDAFDYSKLTPKERRHNFELAFRVADEKAGIAPLLDVEDMVIMKRPDWKCVFTYVQSIYRRFRNFE